LTRLLERYLGAETRRLSQMGARAAAPSDPTSGEEAVDISYTAEQQSLRVVHMVATTGAEVLIAPYVLGFRKAREMMFTGERIAAKEAHMLGMVNRLVPREKLEEETLAMAQRIAKAPPFAIKMTKKSLNRALDMTGFREAVQAHHHTHPAGAPERRDEAPVRDARPAPNVVQVAKEK